MKAFALFWYDFIVGDDWTIAVQVAVALAVTALLAHHGLRSAWWLLPLVVAASLTVSLLRATHQAAGPSHEEPPEPTER